MDVQSTRTESAQAGQLIPQNTQQAGLNAGMINLFAAALANSEQRLDTLDPDARRERRQARDPQDHDPADGYVKPARTGATAAARKNARRRGTASPECSKPRHAGQTASGGPGECAHAADPARHPTRRSVGPQPDTPRRHRHRRPIDRHRPQPNANDSAARDRANFRAHNSGRDRPNRAGFGIDR